MSSTVTTSEPTPDGGAPPAAPSSSRLAVLLFTDIAGSTELKSRLGAGGYARLLTRHDQLFKAALAGIEQAQVINDTGDGYLLTFAAASDAVRFALRMQKAVHGEPWGAQPLRVSIGVHLGEITQVDDASGRPRLVGLAIDLAGRLTQLAQASQVLLTRTAFDEARQFLREYPDDASGSSSPSPPPLRWVAHGPYRFKGADEPLEVFEVGGEGIAPLAPPPNSDAARRMVTAAQEETLGWRPAVGLEVPQRVNWLLEAKLGEGTFGEVWLARHERTKEKRVFKFCFDLERLHSFKRELTFFRLLRDALGERRDIARLYDVRLDHPPFFLESEYAPGGNLLMWAEAQGGLANVPLESRLELVAKVADAVAAAHSIGILHKDIKPGNILLHTDGDDGTLRPQLGDFGIGLLVDRSQLAARHITEIGFTGLETEQSSRTGTRMYAPPESLTGRPFTTQGDIYALGVLLYQMAVGDLTRPLASGWERDVEDELLREDISRCVDGDPHRRLTSAAELSRRLRALGQRREKLEAARRRREADDRRRRRLRAGVAATVALFAVLSTGFYAYVQHERLRTTSREAQWAYAAAGLEQGTAMHFEGRVQDSREQFLRARDAYGRFGISTLAPEVGLYRSFRTFGAPINTLRGHGDVVMSVAWVSEQLAGGGGTRVCTAGGDDSTVRLWDARTGRELRRYAGFRGFVGCVAVSRDGRFVAAGGKDRVVRIWEVETARSLRPLEDAPGEVRGVAFSPDRQFVLSSSVQPWGRGGDPDSPVPAAAAAAAATATQPLSGKLRLYDVQREQMVWEVTPPRHVTLCGVAFSSDGRLVLATTYFSNAVLVFDARTGQLLRSLPGHTGHVMSARFAPRGLRILSGSQDQTLRLWDFDPWDANGAVRSTPLAGHTAGVRGVAWVGDGESDLAASCGMDGTLRLWNVATGKLLRTYAGHGAGGVMAVSVAPDGYHAVTAGGDNVVHVWDLRADVEVPTASGGSGEVTALASSADGLLLAAGDDAGRVRVCDGATLRTLATFRAGERPVESLYFATGGKQLLVADDTGDVFGWDATTGRTSVVHKAPAAPGPATTTAATAPASKGSTDQLRGKDWYYTAVAANGTVGISMAADRRGLAVWSPQSGRSAGKLGPTRTDITCVALTPDGTRALCGDGLGTLYCWDVGSGEKRFAVPVGDKLAKLNCIAVSSDGRTALTGGHDMTVRLWDVGDGRRLGEFRGHADAVRAVGFGRDGRTIFSSGSDQTLRMWDASGTSGGRELSVDGRLPLKSYALTVLPPGDAAAVASGPDVSLWNPARAARYAESAASLQAAQAALQANPRDAGALAVLGEWYAFRGSWQWAADVLGEARERGATVSSLSLARCYWQLGRFDEAAAEFRAAAATGRAEAPANYLALCAAAAAASGDGPGAVATTRSATRPATTVSP
jgi:WD40 repeat protein/class 3 adenylate cyclase